MKGDCGKCRLIKMSELIECLKYVGGGVIGGATIVVMFVALLGVPMVYAMKIAESMFESKDAMLVVSLLLIFAYLGGIVGLVVFVAEKWEKFS